MFTLPGKFSQFYLFPKKFRFSSAKISDDFYLVIVYKFWFSPVFSLFQYISPLFLENYYFPPTFANFPLISYNSRFLFQTLCVFRFPLYVVCPWCIYASHNALLHAPESYTIHMHLVTEWMRLFRFLRKYMYYYLRGYLYTVGYR